MLLCHHLLQNHGSSDWIPRYFDNILVTGIDLVSRPTRVRQSLKSVYPAQFGTMLTPKGGELVATRHRHGSITAARDYFFRGMQAAVRNIAQSRSDFPLTIWYAYKQSEGEDEQVASTGW